MSFHPPTEGTQALGAPGHLRELQGDGFQLNVTLDAGPVPRPQWLLGAVSLQESRCTHGLQDIAVTATVGTPGHGLLGGASTSDFSFYSPFFHNAGGLCRNSQARPMFLGSSYR